jgi:hypothetical protein
VTTTIILALGQVILALAITLYSVSWVRLARRVATHDATLSHLAETLERAMSAVQADIEANAQLLAELELERARMAEDESEDLFSTRVRL